MSDQDSEFNFKPLNNLIKALSSKGCQVKIGILGSKNSRTSADGKTLSNSVVGNFHEQMRDEAAQIEEGSSKVPQRSFLRMPITQYLPKKLKEAGLLNKKDLEIIVKEGNTKKLAQKVGVLGVATVLEAFDSGGFGTWPKLSEARIKERAVKNQGQQILVVANSHQLRDSIDFRIEEKS